MTAAQMRKVTARGKRAKITREQKEWNEAQKARKKMLVECRKQATLEFKKVLAEIKQAAKAGKEETTYHAGEEDDRRRAVVDFIEQDLIEDGYRVKLHISKNEPVGSDPERFDTYYTLHLDISWTAL